MRASRLVPLVLALGACATVTSSTDFRVPPSSLFISSVVIQSMFETQEEFSRETARCLIGEERDGALAITTLVPAWINSRDTTNVSFKICPDKGVVGLYHNHPAQNEIHPAASCFLSPVDVETLNLVQVFRVSIITCALPNTLTWMFPGDAHIYRWSGTPPEPTEGEWVR